MKIANQVNLPDLNLSSKLHFPETIQQVQPRYIVGIDWGTRFPVYAFGSDMVFHPIMPPHAIGNVLSYLGNQIDYCRKRNLKKEKKMYKQALNDYITRYVTAYTTYLVGICWPGGVIAVEDQPCFNLLDYVPNDYHFMNDLYLRNIYIALITMGKMAKNIDVIRVSSFDTSNTCPVCGYVSKSNRHHKSHKFKCKNCGTHGNDDAIAAWNIHNRGYKIINGVDFPYNSSVKGYSTLSEHIQYQLSSYMEFLENRDQIIPAKIKSK